MLAGLPAADARVAATNGVAAVMVLLPALWAILPRGWPGRHCALVAIAALLLHVPRSPPVGCIDAQVLDVGQGLAVVVQTASRFLVFDTGLAFRGGGSVAEQVVVPFLRARGAKRVDYLVVSHGDSDHSGGVDAIASHFEVGQLLAGEPSSLLPSARQCRRGQSGEADGVAWRMLHPSRPGTGNDGSCVMELSVGRHSLLLTGDIETAAENDMLRRAVLDAVDVVVVPHHGSQTSSSPAFVAATSPRIAIVSAAYGNRWGFPKPAVVDRWQSAGATVLDTAAAGAIGVRLCANAGLVTVMRDRHERRRLWRPGVE